MSNPTKIVIAIVVIVLVVWGLSAMSDKDGALNSNEPIKIGALIPLTGLAAGIGEENKWALDLAMEDVEKKYPDLNLGLVYEDTAYDPKVAVIAYQKLRNVDKVEAIISGGTKISGPLRTVAQADDVLQIAIWSAASSYSETHDLNYRTTPMSEDNVPVLISYLTAKGYKDLALFYPNDEFGVTYKESFEALAPASGIRLVVVEGYNATDKDFRGSLSKIKVQSPSVLFVAGTAPQLGAIIKQARDLSIDSQLISQGAAENKQMLDGAIGAAEGLIYSYYFEPAGAHAKDFADKYLERYGRVASQYAAEAYTGLMLIAEAINSCDGKVDKGCWKDYLDGFQNSPTVLGLAEINEHGDLKPDEVFLKEVKNGQFVRLED